MLIVGTYFISRRREYDLVPIDLEIKTTLRNLRKSKAEKVTIEEYHSDRNIDGNNDGYKEEHRDQNEQARMQERTLGDCWRPKVNDNHSGIRRQRIDANNFELKASSMVQQK